MRILMMLMYLCHYGKGENYNFSKKSVVSSWLKNKEPHRRRYPTAINNQGTFRMTKLYSLIL